MVISLSLPRMRLKMQIKKIHLENFKKFSCLTINCEKQNILTGWNNAGKSTTLDALRIVHDVLKFAARRKPHLINFEDEICASYELGQQLVRIPIVNISRNYSDEPAMVRVILENDAELIVILHESHAVKVHLKTNMAPPRSGKTFIKEFPLSLVVVPTLGPVEEDEHYLTDATISRSENTRTAHRHLRNILVRKSDEDFEHFSREVSAAWPNIHLEKPQIGSVGQPMQMLFVEDRVPREIYWSGFGFQVWMLMMLQFLRGTPKSTLVLDEPDIYLHPEFQTYLIEMAKKRFGQVFVATHSSAIISEANPGEIILVSDHSKVAERK